MEREDRVDWSGFVTAANDNDCVTKQGLVLGLESFAQRIRDSALVHGLKMARHVRKPQVKFRRGKIALRSKFIKVTHFCIASMR